MIEHDLNGTFAVRDADPGRSFSILWTHSLQDNAGHMDRRSSRTAYTENKTSERVSGIGNYEVMLTRPLFLMLDALLDERTQLFMTVRTWLQTLLAIDKLFHLFVAKFTTFGFLQRSSEERYVYTSDDDLDQCLYYLRTLSNMLRWSSENMWVALAGNSISTDKSYLSLYKITRRDSEMTLLEFFVHVCLKAVSGNYDPDNSELQPRISQLHRTALTLLHQILASPYALPLAELELENILIGRLTSSLEEPDPFIQVLLLDAVFDSLGIRNASRAAVVPFPMSPTSEHKPSITQDSARGLRKSASIDRTSHQTVAQLSLPTSLIGCLQAGLSATSSRPVLDSWVGFLTDCLPFYTNVIFQIIIPLVETFCSQIGQTFDELCTNFKDVGSLVCVYFMFYLVLLVWFSAYLLYRCRDWKVKIVRG